MQKILVILGLIGIGVVGRLVPHIPNATPITAITVVGNKHVGRIWAIAIPLLAMLASDAIIGFYDWKILVSVYLSFAIVGCITSYTRKHADAFSTAMAVVSSSAAFFIITNFSVWLFSPWYEKSVAGLFYCYELALPFFRNMLLGDFGYTFALLGAWNLIYAISKTKILTFKIA